MPTLAAIRDQQRSARLRELRLRVTALLPHHPGASVWLFGSWARGDWDGLSDVDLLAIAADQGDAEALADSLLAAGLADDVIALSEPRWQRLRRSEDPYWRAIGAEALRLDPP